MNFQNYRKIILNSWKLAIKCNEATKYSSFSPRFNNYRLNVLEFFVIHVSIFLLLLLLLSNLRISRTGSTMTSASLRYPKPKVDRARNGEEEGKGREGDSFSPVPYRAIVVIFFSILPNRGGESGHGRNGDGLFE